MEAFYGRKFEAKEVPTTAEAKRKKAFWILKMSCCY